MKTMPDIGTRVRFTREDKPENTITGTVVTHYPSESFHVAGKKVTTNDSAEIKVDSIPDWWPYPDADTFCPDIHELEEI